MITKLGRVLVYNIRCIYCNTEYEVNEAETSIFSFSGDSLYYNCPGCNLINVWAKDRHIKENK